MARTVDLPSGRWEWTVHDEEGSGARPRRGARGPLARTLVLQETANPANRMVVRVPPHLGEPGDGAAVAAAAVHPQRRFVQGEDGVVWAVWPVEHDPDVAEAMAPRLDPSREIRASREGDPARASLLPGGRGLGELTDDELLALLREGHGP